MKKWLIVVILLAAAGTLFAAPDRHKGGMYGWKGADLEFLQEEIEAILAANGSKTLGDMTVEEAQELLGQISVARQQAAFIERSKAMSFMMPGMGQFANKDPLSGSLFLTADLLVAAGTLVGAYFLLPSELQFGELNYFTDSYATIKNSWEAQSFVDLLPSLGVLAGGWLLSGGIRFFASKHAEKLARRNIEDGTITFEPELVMIPFGPGGMGVGMHMRY
jgi:hypothetical protein